VSQLQLCFDGLMVHGYITRLSMFPDPAGLEVSWDRGSLIHSLLLEHGRGRGQEGIVIC
jgi:hypothetical protein